MTSPTKFQTWTTLQTVRQISEIVNYLLHFRPSRYNRDETIIRVDLYKAIGWCYSLQVSYTAVTESLISKRAQVLWHKHRECALCAISDSTTTQLKLQSGQMPSRVTCRYYIPSNDNSICPDYSHRLVARYTNYIVLRCSNIRTSARFIDFIST